MVIAGIVCDAIFMYIHRYRERYRAGKFVVCQMHLEGTSSTDSLVLKEAGETNDALIINLFFFLEARNYFSIPEHKSIDNRNSSLYRSFLKII
jgi:hypothetical protein